MRFLEKLFDRVFGKPTDPLNGPVKFPVYTYWSYREDIFNPKLTMEDIWIRSGGNIPSLPRYPKEGEVWEFKRCNKHEENGHFYPWELRFDPSRNYWPFLFCGCLHLIYDKKVKS